ncbi:hypothetical protein RFI_28450, partial [Reticulomyxa filosa]
KNIYKLHSFKYIFGFYFIFPFFKKFEFLLIRVKFWNELTVRLVFKMYFKYFYLYLLKKFFKIFFNLKFLFLKIGVTISVKQWKSSDCNISSKIKNEKEVTRKSFEFNYFMLVFLSIICIDYQSGNSKILFYVCIISLYSSVTTLTNRQHNDKHKKQQRQRHNYFFFNNNHFGFIFQTLYVNKCAILGVNILLHSTVFGAANHVVFKYGLILTFYSFFPIFSKFDNVGECIENRNC